MWLRWSALSVLDPSQHDGNVITPFMSKAASAAHGDGRRRLSLPARVSGGIQVAGVTACEHPQIGRRRRDGALTEVVGGEMQRGDDGAPGRDEGRDPVAGGVRTEVAARPPALHRPEGGEGVGREVAEEVVEVGSTRLPRTDDRVVRKDVGEVAKDVEVPVPRLGLARRHRGERRGHERNDQHDRRSPGCPSEHRIVPSGTPHIPSPLLCACFQPEGRDPRGCPHPESWISNERAMEQPRTREGPGSRSLFDLPRTYRVFRRLVKHPRNLR